MSPWSFAHFIRASKNNFERPSRRESIAELNIHISDQVFEYPKTMPHLGKNKIALMPDVINPNIPSGRGQEIISCLAPFIVKYL